MRNLFGTRRGNRRQLSGEFESLREDLSHLREDLMAFGQTLLSTGKSEAESTGSRVKADLQRTVASLSEKMGAARERGRDSLESMQQQIEERPFTSLGIAFAIGLLFGKLLDWPTGSED